MAKGLEKKSSVILWVKFIAQLGPKLPYFWGLQITQLYTQPYTQLDKHTT
jgi:hypothetical protein